jgi:type I restriction enzyme S subunit
MDWEVKKLGELLKVQNGYAFNSKLFTNETGTPLIRIRDIKKGIGTVTNFNGSYDKKYEVKSGDFLIGMDGDFGCYEWKGDTALLNQRVCRLQDFSNRINSRFLFYDINKYLKAIEEVTAFATVKHISSKQIEAIEIPLPPLPEQKRIVAILDEAFEKIAKTKENAEKNLKNANEIFESYLQNVFENKGEGWEEKMLGEVCDVIGGGTPSKANNDFYGGDIRWATVRDMKGEIITDTEYKITKDAVKNSSTNIIPKGNVIIATRVGLGKICLIEHDTAINQDLRGVLPINPKVLSVDFLYRWFKSIAHKIAEHGTGATVQGVKLPFIKSLPIPLPPLKEQQAIVTKLDALSAETKKLEKIYTQKLADLEELKKSIIAKAFNGELTVASA